MRAQKTHTHTHTICPLCLPILSRFWKSGIIQNKVDFLDLGLSRVWKHMREKGSKHYKMGGGVQEIRWFSAKTSRLKKFRKFGPKANCTKIPPPNKHQIVTLRANRVFSVCFFGPIMKMGRKKGQNTIKIGVSEKLAEWKKCSFWTAGVELESGPRCVRIWSLVFKKKILCSEDGRDSTSQNARFCSESHF